jgi:hypothetical protein
VTTYNVRPGEAVCCSETRQIVCSTFYTDGIGRPLWLGLEAGIPTILPAACGGSRAAEEIAGAYRGIEVIDATVGVLPVVLDRSGAGSRERNEFLGITREETAAEQGDRLTVALGRRSLAAAVARLIDEGAYAEPAAVGIVQGWYDLAVAAGNVYREPWTALVDELLETLNEPADPRALT